jgi:hypothetical protein
MHLLGIKVRYIGFKVEVITKIKGIHVYDPAPCLAASVPQEVAALAHPQRHSLIADLLNNMRCHLHGCARSSRRRRQPLLSMDNLCGGHPP